jgi:hypothetical protein
MKFSTRGALSGLRRIPKGWVLGPSSGARCPPYREGLGRVWESSALSRFLARLDLAW